MLKPVRFVKTFCREDSLIIKIVQCTFYYCAMLISGVLGNKYIVFLWMLDLNKESVMALLPQEV